MWRMSPQCVLILCRPFQLCRCGTCALWLCSGSAADLPWICDGSAMDLRWICSGSATNRKCIASRAQTFLWAKQESGNAAYFHAVSLSPSLSQAVLGCPRLFMLHQCFSKHSNTSQILLDLLVLPDCHIHTIHTSN